MNTVTEATEMTRQSWVRLGAVGLALLGSVYSTTAGAVQSSRNQASLESQSIKVVDSHLPASFKPGMNKVSFQSEGEQMVGTLFLPANYKQGDKLPVIIIDGPWTQVKEQVGYRYGQELANRGFATLAINHRFWGESGGEPRSFESPRAKVQDLRNAISFLQTLPAVDANRIGGLGVCFGASYIMMTAAEDKRLKSVATTAAWLHDRPSIREQYGIDGYDQRMRAGQDALRRFQQNGTVDRVPAASTTDQRAAMFLQDTSGSGDYYTSLQRGVIPPWKNEFATMSWVDWLNLDSINPIAPRITVPLLMVHSDNSALPANVRKFYGLVKAPKELYWTKGMHLDFYDREPNVTDAVQAVTNHFRNTLLNAKVPGETERREISKQ